MVTVPAIILLGSLEDQGYLKLGKCVGLQLSVSSVGSSKHLISSQNNKQNQRRYNY